jgi:hypothetical protein
MQRLVVSSTEDPSYKLVRKAAKEKETQNTVPLKIMADREDLVKQLL